MLHNNVAFVTCMLHNVVTIFNFMRNYSIGSNELMGCTAIGSTFIGIGRDHWLEMLDNPRKPVAQWYPLMESLPANIPTTSDSLPLTLGCLSYRFVTT